MALQLGEYLVWGELRNSRPNSVHGYLKLRGMEMPVYVELTGDPSPDLVGKAFRFKPRRARRSRSAGQNSERAPRKPRLPFRVHPHQVGPTGRMTAACRTAARLEAADPSQPDEAAPEYKRCVFLEWFSQNGRVIIELADPVLEVADVDDDRNGDSSWGPPPEPEVWENLCRESTLEGLLLEPDEGEPHPGADIRDDTELTTEELVQQIELIDNLYTGSGGEPLRPLIREFVSSTPLEELTDEEAELALKYALAQLALRGVAIHACEHASTRGMLHYIRTTIAERGECYPPLRKTTFVQNYLIGENCEDCLKRYEEQDE